MQYPLSIPMAATEGGVTPWYLLTLAMGGQLFDKNFKPQFADPGSAGYKALQWERDAVKNGWVSPGSVTLDDGPSFDKFNAGAERDPVRVRARATCRRPTTRRSRRSPPHAKGGLVPGDSGPGATFGLPEGLAIPVTAKHKDAARGVHRVLDGARRTRSCSTRRPGCCRAAAPCVNDMAAERRDRGRQRRQRASSSTSSRCSRRARRSGTRSSRSAAQGLLNSAVKGDTSVGDALKQLSDKATELAANGS